MQLASLQGDSRRPDVIRLQGDLGMVQLMDDEPEVQLHDLRDHEERDLARVVTDGMLQRVQHRGAHVVLVRRRAFEVENRFVCHVTTMPRGVGPQVFRDRNANAVKISPTP